MKKLCLLVLGLFLLHSTTVCHAHSCDMPIAVNAKPINIIYIHGSYETKEAFDKSVKNVHDDMVKYFQTDSLMYSRLLDGGKKKIGKEGIIFFWADETKEELKMLDRALSYVKNVGSKIAQFGRETLSHTLHDAIWISKSSNSTPLLNDLNKLVKEEYSKGNQVLIYGYSAGSLLAAQYMTQKLPVININELESKDDSSYTGKYFREVTSNYKFNPTCLDALKESKLVFYTDAEEFVTNPDITYLQKEFPNLNNYTEKYCAPQNAVKGFVVFGTPLTLFDTTTSQKDAPMNELFKLAMKYLVENNIFFITLNYQNDFIGMPLPIKPTMKDLSDDVSPNGGFVYDGSGIKARTGVLSSHLAYWSNGKRFAKSIVKTYNDGYKYFYELNE